MRLRLRFTCLLLPSVVIVGCKTEGEDVRFATSGLVYAIEISNDGSLLACGSRLDSPDGGNIQVFDLNQKKERFSFTSGQWVWDVDISPDQRWLVTGSDGGLMVWDLRDDSTAAGILATPEQGISEVKRLAISPTGNYLAVARSFKTEIWDFNTRQHIHTIQDGNDGAIAFSPDDNWLAVGNYHGISVYAVANGKKLGEGKPFMPGGQLIAVRFSSDGKRLFAACPDTYIFSVDVEGEQVMLTEISNFSGGGACADICD